jgi:hypothetical protein
LSDGRNRRPARRIPHRTRRLSVTGRRCGRLHRWQGK